MDSNFQYAGAVNLVVGPFGWVVLIGCGSGRGASGTARYQRRGWAILAAGVGAARRTARSMKAASSGLSTGLPARWPQIDGIGRNSVFRQVLHYHRQQVRQRVVISCWRRGSASSGSRWFTASRWGRRRRSIGRHCSPTGSSRIAPICGSAKTSAHNFVFFEGVKAALTADPVWQDGWFATRRRAASRRWAGSMRLGAEPGVRSRGDLAQDRLLVAGGLPDRHAGDLAPVVFDGEIEIGLTRHHGRVGGDRTNALSRSPP